MERPISASKGSPADLKFGGLSSRYPAITTMMSAHSPIGFFHVKNRLLLNNKLTRMYGHPMRT